MIKYGFPDGETDVATGELTDFVGVSIEAMDDPGLAWLVFFMQSQNIRGGFYAMDDQGFPVLFGEEDVLFKDFQLTVVGVIMDTVETSFPDGDDFVFFKKCFQRSHAGQFPWMDAIGISKTDGLVPMCMDINKRNFLGDHEAKITNFADKLSIHAAIEELDIADCHCVGHLFPRIHRGVAAGVALLHLLDAVFLI